MLSTCIIIIIIIIIIKAIYTQLTWIVSVYYPIICKSLKKKIFN
jgi:hypothetical protein